MSSLRYSADKKKGGGDNKKVKTLKVTYKVRIELFPSY